MATQITAWKSSDGSVHERERDAVLADAGTVVEDAAEALLNELTSYACMQERVRDIIDAEALVLKLADALRARRSLQENP